MKNADKITVYFYGNVNGTLYEGKQTTVKTLKKWREEKNPKLNDVAFIYEGLHKNLHGYELDVYEAKNALYKLSASRVCKENE